MSDNLKKVLDKFLISDSELARASGMNEKTVKNAKNGSHKQRTQTKRALLDGLNRILKGQGKKAVGTEVFD